MQHGQRLGDLGALTVKRSATLSDVHGMRRLRLPASRPPSDPEPRPRPASVIPEDALRAAARQRAAVEAVIAEDSFDRDQPLIPQIRARLTLVA